MRLNWIIKWDVPEMKYRLESNKQLGIIVLVSKITITIANITALSTLGTMLDF